MTGFMGQEAAGVVGQMAVFAITAKRLEIRIEAFIPTPHKFGSAYPIETGLP